MTVRSTTPPPAPAYLVLAGPAETSYGVAAELGVRETLVGAWRRGHHRPSLERLPPDVTARVVARIVARHPVPADRVDEMARLGWAVTLLREAE